MRVSRYEVIETLVRGAAGVVYKALDTKLERPVALKVIAPCPDFTEECRARLLAEAQAWSACTASGIVTVYDIGEDGGRSFVAMELPDGPSLRQVLDEPVAFDLEQAIAVMVRLCSALACAHRRGIVHHDIHPGNIFLPADEPPKVASFGVSTGLPGRDPSAADALPYLSPEQMQGRADARSDQYSLAAVFREWIGSGTVLHAGTPLVSFESAATIVPGLAHILERAMNREPAKRFPDLRAMQSQLELVLERTGTSVHGPGTIAPREDCAAASFPPASRATPRVPIAARSRFFDGSWSRSNPALVALAMVATVSVAVALLASFPDQRQQAASARPDSRTQASRPATPKPAGAALQTNAAARAAAAEVPTPLDPTGRAASESARDRALAARFRSAKSEALGQAPELHLAAQAKEIEADAAYARSDYGLAAVLYDMARDGYELAARQAEMEAAAFEKARVDAQVAADEQSRISRNDDVTPVEVAPKQTQLQDPVGKALAAARQVTRDGPIIVEVPKEKPPRESPAGEKPQKEKAARDQPPREEPPRPARAFASVFTQSTDGRRGGGTWGACSRGDAASARECAKANCDANRKSDRPCVEVASSQPGQYCAVAKAAGVGVSSGACDAEPARAQAAAMDGCREQVSRHYGSGAAICGIAWSNAQ